MTEAEQIAAARHALVHLDDEAELLSNALLPQGHAFTYGTVRFAVLGALDSADSSGARTAESKRQRLREILVRCDLGREAHKSVIHAMSLSRRQFYRERREALLRLAGAIVRGVSTMQRAEELVTSTATIDLGDAAEAYIEALRSAGQYELVLHEASSLARRLDRDSRALECWLVASEAARFCADTPRARAILASAVESSTGDSYWQSLWVASSVMSLLWVDGDGAQARATFERAAPTAREEQTLLGKDAVLLGIMLTNVARIELECGRWDRARSLLERATRLSHNGSTSKRQSMLKLSALISRLSGHLALHADSDRDRSLAGYRHALQWARTSGELGTIAETAIHYAGALGIDAIEPALRYIDYGLEIVRRYYPGDRLAELTLESVPILLHARGPQAAREAVANAKRPGLGERDGLFIELAEAKVAACAGASDEALLRAENAATELFSRGIYARACDAALAGLEAAAVLGLKKRARKRLADLRDVLGFARGEARRRARRLGAEIAPEITLPA